MPKKKTEETVEETVSEVTEVTEEVTEELAAAETQVDESAEVVEAKADESAEVAEVVEAKAEESVEVEAKAETEETPKKVSTKKKAEKTEKVVEKVADSNNEPKKHKRAEKVGIVQSDKMTKTVTVRVDRVVKHPVYRKYIKRKKNFMAHDEQGAAVGDKVRIIETRPLSARKRWRVVEIIQKAEK